MLYSLIFSIQFPNFLPNFYNRVGGVRVIDKGATKKEEKEKGEGNVDLSKIEGGNSLLMSFTLP